MGSGTNLQQSTMGHGLLRRRYSVPEIIMRKHKLANQKSYDESSAATAPSPNITPLPGGFSQSTPPSTSQRDFAISSGSDSNLSRGFGCGFIGGVNGGEMSMRKTTLLRRMWSRELKRYDTRSGSWSPPLRRSQRRLNTEPAEHTIRCEECRKLDEENGNDNEEAAPKRLRLFGARRAISDSAATSRTHSSINDHNQMISSSERPQFSTTTSSSCQNSPLLKSSQSLDSTVATSNSNKNVHIFMTPLETKTTSSDNMDQSQDLLRIEIDPVDDSDNTLQRTIRDECTSNVITDENQNPTIHDSDSTLLHSEDPRNLENVNGDSPLDLFISKLLINNLKNLAEEISQEYRNNNNIHQNDDSTNDSSPNKTKISTVYLTPERIAAVNRSGRTSVIQIIDSNANSDSYLTQMDETVNTNEPEYSGNSATERVIYFPSYSFECKDDMSSYTSNCSDFELSDMPSTDLVKVNTGSTYPMSDTADAIIVPRMLGKIPRTESMEAQPSSASIVEENENESDGSVSLVDSLDDPQNVENESESVSGAAISSENTNEDNIISENNETEEQSNTLAEFEEIEPPKSLPEKGEAFFVPIMDSGQEVKTQVLPVSNAMPEKLKEKINQRQRELDLRREEETKRKQRLLEKIMDPKMDDESFCEKSPTPSKKSSPVKEKLKPKSEHITSAKQSKNKATMLRADIGLLESYTIDSKGNMQFRVPQKTEQIGNVSNKRISTNASVAGRSAAYRKQGVVTNRPPPQPVQSQRKSTVTKTKKPSHISGKKDIQKMTIFQTQSDIITPDTDNGPRRVYQKTEIQDGEKRIEILEIVECIESSPESSPERNVTYRCSSSKSAILANRSKIPIPIYKMGRASGYQRSTRCTVRESSPTPGKLLSRNLPGTSASTKVDRVIAELLIDALNRPEEIGIEIIRSPKEVLSRDKTNRRQVLPRRNTPRRSANSNKYHQIFEVIPEEKSSLSVDSSTEETSTKVSTTQTSSQVSSNQTSDFQTTKPTTVVASSSSSSFQTSNPTTISTATVMSSTSGPSTDTISSCNKTNSTSTSVTTTTTAPTTSSLSKNVTTTSMSSSESSGKNPHRGRAAVDTTEPKAWIGFFKRHNGSSMDEDEDKSSQPYPNSTTENSRQHTITTASSITARAGTMTPKPSSPNGYPPSSPESDNILNLIDKTFTKEETSQQLSNVHDEGDYKHIDNAEISTMSSSGLSSRNTATTTTSSQITTTTTTTTEDYIPKKCIQSKICRKCQERQLLEPDIVENVVKIELRSMEKSTSSSSVTTPHSEVISDMKKSSPKKDLQCKTEKSQKCEKEKVDIWRVQSPDICKRAIPKLRGQHSKMKEEPTAEKIVEIDTRSFVIIPENDGCLSSPSRQSKIPIIEHHHDHSTDDQFHNVPNKCFSCCFCNPDLHHSTPDDIERCVYCNRKRTPQKKEEETNTETDFFLNDRVYQSMSKSDHVHTRTRSRDSDVISTKCTRTNEKIRRYVPDDRKSRNETKKISHDDSKGQKVKNLSRPKNVNNLPKTETGTIHKVTHDDIRTNLTGKDRTSSPDAKPFRFPSPYTNISSNSYDGTSTPSSSSDSTCPTTPNQKCSLPPATKQRHSINTRQATSTTGRRRMGSKQSPENLGSTTDKNVADSTNNINNNVTKNNNINNNNNNSLNGTQTNGQNNGWSVTVAGSYSQDLAPDLEMRLSFPKQQQQIKSQSFLQLHDQTGGRHQNQHPQRNNSRNPTTTLAPTNGNPYNIENSLLHDDDILNDNYAAMQRNYSHPALPSSMAGNLNPKRTLTRIVSERTHSHRNYNFPDVNSTSHQNNNQMVTRQTAKKAIKHLECSVVTSATRTISNFGRGSRRTMSYQALNTTHELHKFQPNQDRHTIRDNSLDLGNLSSPDDHRHRRSSLDGSSRTQSETMMALSIMGNAISPEQKPRVPTMSEKDLTGRHNACFTRNRAFFT